MIVFRLYGLMENLTKFFTPFFKILKIFGYLPFLILNNGQLRISKSTFIYSLCFLILLDYFLYLRIIHKDEYRLEGSFLSKISFLCGALLSRAFTEIAIISNICQMKRLESLIKLMSRCDKEVSQGGNQLL